MKIKLGSVLFAALAVSSVFGKLHFWLLGFFQG
jgi:hypothetical protein